MRGHDARRRELRAARGAREELSGGSLWHLRCACDGCRCPRGPWRAADACGGARGERGGAWAGVHARRDSPSVTRARPDSTPTRAGAVRSVKGPCCRSCETGRGGDAFDSVITSPVLSGRGANREALDHPFARVRRAHAVVAPRRARALAVGARADAGLAL